MATDLAVELDACGHHLCSERRSRMVANGLARLTPGRPQRWLLIDPASGIARRAWSSYVARDAGVPTPVGGRFPPPSLRGRQAARDGAQRAGTPGDGWGCRRGRSCWSQPMVGVGWGWEGTYRETGLHTVKSLASLYEGPPNPPCHLTAFGWTGPTPIDARRLLPPQRRGELRQANGPGGATTATA
jgi:hypothetical protein